MARIAKEGYDPANGARPLRRRIHAYVEDPIAEGIFYKIFTGGDSLVLCVEDNKIVVKKEEPGK